MKWLTALALVVPLAGCSIDTHQGEVGVYRTPEMPGAAGAGPETPSFFLTMYLRDFKKYDSSDPSTNPAFDNVGSENRVVADKLGADRKPVYELPTSMEPTFGAAYFDQWYRDVPGTNVTLPFPLPITIDDQGFYEYDSQKSGTPDEYQGVARRVFFPLDDGGPYPTSFGNQGQTHNFAFTGELHVSFVPSAGDTLEVRADDDLYVFIDDQLVIDLGGTHIALSRTINLDDVEITLGVEHALHFFYAERLGATGALSVRSSFALQASR
jgi:fibro-slime domain-containing protein